MLFETSGDAAKGVACFMTMMTSMLTVKNIVAGEMLYDIWDVNEDAEYHEAGGSGAEEAWKSVRMVPRRVRSAA